MPSITQSVESLLLSCALLITVSHAVYCSLPHPVKSLHLSVIIKMKSVIFALIHIYIYRYHTEFRAVSLSARNACLHMPRQGTIFTQRNTK